MYSYAINQGKCLFSHNSGENGVFRCVYVTPKGFYFRSHWATSNPTEWIETDYEKAFAELKGFEQWRDSDDKF